jgi:ketosteroid isomerase-like protein
MTPLPSSFALVPLLLACASAPHASSYGGIYSSADSVIELHRGPEGALRGYVRTNDRIAALAPVQIRDGALHANATYDDGTRAELTVALKPGPVLVLDGHEYRRLAVESPADATVRREIEEAYARLAKAVETKDFDAFQALRVTQFATIPPDGTPKSGSRMAERARGLLERIQPPITTTNDILELTVRGDDAIATVRQKFTRMQPIDGTPHKIHTEVTQRETWTRTLQGWKLLFVDEVRDPITLDDGRRME